MHDSIKMIYEQWHEFARTRNVDALLDLYSADAIFESPLVPAILDRESGVLCGHLEIRLFLEEGTKRRPNDLVRWFRTGKYFLQAWYGFLQQIEENRLIENMS